MAVGTQGECADVLLEAAEEEPQQVQGVPPAKVAALLLLLAATALLGTYALYGRNAEATTSSYAKAAHQDDDALLWPRVLPHEDAEEAARHAEHALRKLVDSHLTEECKGVMVSVIKSVQRAAEDVLRQCKDGQQESEECKSASSAAQAKTMKLSRMMQGICTDDGVMLCKVSEVDANISEKESACLPDVCKPRNVLLDALNRRKGGVGICEGCKLQVSCDGHDVIDEDMLEDEE